MEFNDSPPAYDKATQSLRQTTRGQPTAAHTGASSQGKPLVVDLRHHEPGNLGVHGSILVCKLLKSIYDAIHMSSDLCCQEVAERLTARTQTRFYLSTAAGERLFKSLKILMGDGVAIFALDEAT